MNTIEKPIPKIEVIPMDFFEFFTSNTLAGSGNQLFFTMEASERRTERIFYKITNGGTYGYSLLFSGVIDSTYADGSVSVKNTVCDAWTIHAARIGRCSTDGFAYCPTVHHDTDVTDWQPLTFGGKALRLW